MIREYIVSITDEVEPDGFERFENDYSPSGQLVRCKDCKHYTGGLDGYCEKWFRKTGGNMFFCADGEKES